MQYRVPLIEYLGRGNLRERDYLEDPDRWEFDIKMEL